eukprot:3262842-Amphidinium_carterae.1
MRSLGSEKQASGGVTSNCDGAAYHPQWHLLRRAGWAMVEVSEHGLFMRGAYGPLPVLHSGPLRVRTDCRGVHQAFEADGHHNAINEHLGRLLRQHGRGRLQLVHVRAHLQEPRAFSSPAWTAWNANRLADEYTKLGAQQHLLVTVEGVDAVTVAHHMMALAKWIGLQVSMLIHGTLRDCDMDIPEGGQPQAGLTQDSAQGGRNYK